MAMPPGQMGGPPQQWNPGMGPPPQSFRQGNGPPRGNPNGGPPQMRPPPMGGMPTFPGYEGVGQFGMMAPMPPPPPPPPPPKVPDMEFNNDAAFMDEDGARSAVFQFVSENCCYGKGCAQDMSISDIKSLSALHYTLDTFTESRKTGYAREPYRGGMIDGPENGPPPPPWAIPCLPDERFNTHQKKMPVPHTDSIQPCHVCEARGFVRCWRCDGWGQNVCHVCDGGGQQVVTNAEGGEDMVPCGRCGGDGKVSCSTCGGDGRITCRECEGFRNLRCYIEMTVSYENHKGDHIIEKSDMPDELVRDVSGTTIFEQTLPAVPPIIGYPVPEICENSIRLVNQHRGAWPSERQLEQRQNLRAVPITECGMSWKDLTSRFWVFGNEKKVHFPDYPQTCCWGCSIL